MLPLEESAFADVEWVSDEEVKALNAKVMADRLPPHEGRLMNLTFVEVMNSRDARDIAQALSLVYARLKAYGIPVLRLHTDRAREFLSTTVRHWAASRSIWQTMTGGDDPPGNGRVEAEVNQLKRRLRLVLSTSAAPTSLWPCALRHVAAERLGFQMARLGLPQRPMLPFYSQVMVKVKRWHVAGALRSPYKQVRLLGPSPMMHHGWAVQDPDGHVQHARVALLPSGLADQAEYELQLIDASPTPVRRLHGKQSVDPVLNVGELLAAGPMASSSASALPDLERSGGESLSSLSSSLSSLQACGEKQGIIYHGQKAWDANDWLLECHWRLRQHLDEELRRVPTSEEEGSVMGRLIEALDGQVQCLEMDLMHGQAVEDGGCLKMMNGEPPSAADVKVLQTYTVSTADVRKELKEWVPALKAEYNQLTVVTGAIKPIKKSDLDRDPALEKAELIPGKLVATVKAPDAKRKARLVICGNMVDPEGPDGLGQVDVKAAKAQNYAGGIDATALRAVLRKGASRGWDIVTTDVRTAFLLAPRTRDERTLVVKPPKIMVESGICDEQELWLVQRALYGLTTSPADWAVYRDSVLKTFEWNNEEGHFWLRATKEQNLWKIIKRRENVEKPDGDLVEPDGDFGRLMLRIRGRYPCDGRSKDGGGLHQEVAGPMGL